MIRYFYIALGSIMILSYFGIITYYGIKDIGLIEMLKIIGSILGIILWLAIGALLVTKGISLKDKNNKEKHNEN